ncbi:MAG: hypothetical protein SangKO_083930 [Sandaracinaceae bacterium]
MAAARVSRRLGAPRIALLAFEADVEAARTAAVRVLRRLGGIALVEPGRPSGYCVAERVRGTSKVTGPPGGGKVQRLA